MDNDEDEPADCEACSADSTAGNIPYIKPEVSKTTIILTKYWYCCTNKY